MAAVLAVVAVVAAQVLQRRKPAAPARSGVRAGWAPPGQLDRADFDDPERPWLVAVFTSSACTSCLDATAKAEVLASTEVVVQEVSWQDRKDLHDRYDMEVVPTTMIVDAEGVVHAAFVGAPTATDLWAAMAEARFPGSSPEPDLGQAD